MKIGGSKKKGAVIKMKYMQALFSLKYEPQMRIRRSVNQIEDALSEHYGLAEMPPLPDEFAPEVPRIILHSKYGHSQISFSQISVNLTVDFDDKYWEDFEATKRYILERLQILMDLLKVINIHQFCFAGLSYNIHLDTTEHPSVQYMVNLLELGTSSENIYEASRRMTMIEDNTFFINEQVGTFKEYQTAGIPELMNKQNSKLTAEGVNLVLDVNNRYEFQQNSDLRSIDEFHDIITKIYELIERTLTNWR